MLQWIGGLGIVIVAMIFLPALGSGGMQLFRSEAFDTLGKILPRAGQIAYSLTGIYLALSLLCFLGYILTGMATFDSAVHAMTTVSTGGMANYDSSFFHYGAGPHYVAVLFMVLASLPFVRFVQLTAGSARPLVRDSQVRAFLLVILAVAAILTVWLAARAGPSEQAFREVLFNVVSVITGTGYASADYNAWGPFAATTFFGLGLIGGCSGSTTCSVKVFRYQLLFSAISAEVKLLHSPNCVAAPRYEGRPVSDAVMNSVMAFFMLFYLTLAITTVILVLIGLEPVAAISGAASALANVGPGLGEEIGPAGNFAGLPDAAKWVLAAAMLVGRLELMSVFVLFTAAFWRG
jgi:trk system potassium uptake protein TrkH